MRRGAGVRRQERAHRGHGRGATQAWGGQACGRELIMLLGSKVPRGENHEVVEVPRLRLAQTAACRNSAVGWGQTPPTTSVRVGDGLPVETEASLGPAARLCKGEPEPRRPCRNDRKPRPA